MVEIVNLATKRRVVEKRISRMLNETDTSSNLTHFIGLEHVVADNGKRFLAVCSMTRMFILDGQTLEVTKTIPGVFASFDCKPSLRSPIRERETPEKSDFEWPQFTMVQRR